MRIKNCLRGQSLLLFSALFFCVLQGASGQLISLSCSPTSGPTQAGAAYSATCTASGGIAPYTFSISSGTLPSGLTPNPTSTSITVSGIPTVAGSYNYTVQVTDSTPVVPMTAQQNYTGTIAPNITAINPNTAPVGQPGITLTINGAGFGSDSVVNFNSTALSTTVVGPNQVTASVPANLLTAVGTDAITLTSAGATSNVAPFTVTPSISSLSPNSATAGGPDLALTVNGAGFGTDAVVSFNGTALTTTFISSTQVTATIPAGMTVLAGSFPVTVTTGGLTSSAASFAVNPSIVSLSPSSATAGGPSFTLTVNGAGFQTGATVSFNGTTLATTVVNANQLTAPVAANLIATGGAIPVTVTSGGLPSNTVSFSVVVVAPAPVISSISPNSMPAGAPTTLTVNGSNFGTDSVVSFNGTALSTAFVNATQVNATVPAGVLGIAGVYPITLTTGGVTSNSASFSVLPAISSLSPTSATAGAAGFTLVVNGTGFPPTAVVQWNGAALATSYVNSTQLNAPVLANLIAGPGTAQVTVSASGLTSGALTFTVLPGPAITSITPATVTAGGPAFTLTVNGSGFASGAVVQWNGSNLSTNVLSSNQMTASVPANLVANAGSAQIVVNSSGVVSNAQTLTVVAGPALSTLSPNTITAGSSAFSLIVNGTGFINGAAVQWNGSALPTTFNSANQLTAAVPANLVSNVGTAQVSVSSGGVITNQVPFTVVAAPTISFLSPSTITAGSGVFTLTVNGSGFAPGAVVQWNGTALATSYVSSGQLAAPVLPIFVAQPGTAQITVSSGGVTSNAVNLTVVAGPAIASLSPSTISAGGPAFSLTVNGTGFGSDAIVQWNGITLTATSAAATQLTVSVPANLITNASTVSVTVQSGGVTSNVSTFAVVAGPTVSSLSPAAITAGTGAGLAPATICPANPASVGTLTVNGSGFIPGATVQWNGQGLATAFVSTGRLTACVLSSLVQGYGPARITVISNGTASNALTLSLGVPAITLTGLQSTSEPTQQLQVGIQLASATPATLTGTLRLSFSTTAPGPPAGYVDPGLQFSSGTTTLSFSIPAGSTTLAAGSIQQGTVEGTITVTLVSLTSGTTNLLPSGPVTGTVIIPPLPPVITAGSAQITNVSASGFDVVVTGYSTTRDMTTANFSFTPAAGTQFTGPATFAVPVNSQFATWFSSPAGQTNGSMFLLTVPFTISGSSSVLQSVSVTLTNSVGTSVPATASK